MNASSLHTNSKWELPIGLASGRLWLISVTKPSYCVSSNLDTWLKSEGMHSTKCCCIPLLQTRYSRCKSCSLLYQSSTSWCLRTIVSFLPTPKGPMGFRACFDIREQEPVLCTALHLRIGVAHPLCSSSSPSATFCNAGLATQPRQQRLRTCIYPAHFLCASNSVLKKRRSGAAA